MGVSGDNGAVEYALTRVEWERIYSRLDGDSGNEDPWLDRWQGTLEAHRGSPVLDLGCGAGHEARYLTRPDEAVVAADFSAKALELTRQRAPEAETRDLDLTDPLPFPDAHFGVIVASLSLHYFLWRQTEQVLEDIRRCLCPNGHLLARLNSTKDTHYATVEKKEIEPNYYLVHGHPKRLFDRKDVDALFSQPWTLEHASEQTTARYGATKTLWEIAVRAPKKPKA